MLNVMFLIFFSLFFIFGVISGTLVLGSHILSFWESIILVIFIFLCTILSFFIIGICLYGYCYYDICLILIFDFCHIYVSFICTGIYMFILLLIDLVFCFIIFYAFYYMYFDLFLSSFMNIFWMFVICMNFFIISYDLLTAYCGWELLGLFSFFLISYFWYRFFSLNFGCNSFFIGNIGDILLIFAFSVIFSMNGFCTITYHHINFFCVDYYYIVYIILLLICCASTNSTQFGLHIWLPDAMEGPIPVSALIHAATLVVCGIILTSYVSWCIDFWLSYFYSLIIWTTMIVVLMCMCVFYNFDANRYIAFSTICQISFSMFCCICLDLYVGCMFFCYHMFYNAALFIVIGVWIHFFFGLQDIRCYFFLYFCGCILASLLLIFAICNSCSIWFFCGFYCNDTLLCLLMIISFYNVIEFIFVCVIFIFFTIIYNYFLLFILFFVFNCFCLVDCIFLLFDFECCLVYCLACVYMCFICLFFMLDFIFIFTYSSCYIFLSFYLYFYNFFDLAIIILFIIISAGFVYYGCVFFYFFNVDCVMFLWSIFVIISTILVFLLFCCWYLINFTIYSVLFIWNFVIYFSYNLNYCIFFCILWSIYI